MSIRTISQSINLQKQPDSDLNKYITEIGSNGITVHPEGQGNTNYLQIASDMEIVRNGISVAEYGDNVRIGKEDGTKVIIADGSISPYTTAGTYIVGKVNNVDTVLAKFTASGATIGQTGQTHTEIDYHSLQLIDKEGDAYFYISDLRDKNDRNLATITEVFTGNGTNSTFIVGLPIYGEEFTATDSSDSSNTATKTGATQCTFTTAPQIGATITITYKTSDSRAKAYSLGIRASGNIGAMSFAEGSNNLASGSSSHAEGYGTTASGTCSHAEGQVTEASAMCAHAEGYTTVANNLYSHAEGRYAVASGRCAHAEGDTTVASGELSHAEGGNTTASGHSSHAEGWYTVASGNSSHAQNTATIAQRKSQTVIGELNIADTGGTDETTRGDYAFIIGNGTADNARSNALTVDWSGNVQIAGTLTQSSDRSLKEHISYLNNDAVTFIQNLKPAFFNKDSKPHVGFYAQDVESIDQWKCMVGKMNGFKTLGYTEIIAPLVRYCQKLEERITNLEQEVN